MCVVTSRVMSMHRVRDAGLDHGRRLVDLKRKWHVWNADREYCRAPQGGIGRTALLRRAP